MKKIFIVFFLALNCATSQMQASEQKTPQKTYAEQIEILEKKIDEQNSVSNKIKYFDCKKNIIEQLIKLGKEINNIAIEVLKLEEPQHIDLRGIKDKYHLNNIISNNNYIQNQLKQKLSSFN